MKIFPLVVLIVGLAGCDSLPPLEDRDREQEFADLDFETKELRREIESGRRDAIKKARERNRQAALN